MSQFQMTGHFRDLLDLARRHVHAQERIAAAAEDQAKWAAEAADELRSLTGQAERTRAAVETLYDGLCGGQVSRDMIGTELRHLAGIVNLIREDLESATRGKCIVSAKEGDR